MSPTRSFQKIFTQSRHVLVNVIGAIDISKNRPFYLIHKFIFIFSVKSKCNVVGHKMNKIKGTENTFEHTNKTEGVCKTRH